MGMTAVIMICRLQLCSHSAGGLLWFTDHLLPLFRAGAETLAPNSPGTTTVSTELVEPKCQCCNVRLHTIRGPFSWFFVTEVFVCLLQLLHLRHLFRRIWILTQLYSMLYVSASALHSFRFVCSQCAIVHVHPVSTNRFCADSTCFFLQYEYSTSCSVSTRHILSCQLMKFQ